MNSFKDISITVIGNYNCKQCSVNLSISILTIGSLMIYLIIIKIQLLLRNKDMTPKTLVTTFVPGQCNYLSRFVINQIVL